jgi:serine/threonine protein kinase
MQQYLNCNLEQCLTSSKIQTRSLGSGSFGSCYLEFIPCPPHLTAAVAATGHPEYVTRGIPIVTKILLRSGTSLAKVEAEAAACFALSSSKRLPRLYNYLHGQDFSVLVFEAVSASPQNLSQRVHACAAVADGPQHVPLPEILSTTEDVVRGLDDMHQRGWCHLDVKPANIVVANERAYLVDLGISSQVGKQLRGARPGTKGFKDPQIEFCSDRGLDLQVQGAFDFWSAGIVLVYMLARGKRDVVVRVSELAAGFTYDMGHYKRLEMRELLCPEVSAVVEAYEQQLQQQGALRQGGKLLGVHEGLMRLVEGMLQPKQRWSARVILKNVGQLRKRVEMATTR